MLCSKVILPYMEISKRAPGIEPALCWLRDLRLYRSLHEEVSRGTILFLQPCSQPGAQLISQNNSTNLYYLILFDLFLIFVRRQINQIPYVRKIYPRSILYLRFIKCRHFFEVWRDSVDVRFMFKRGLFSGEGKSCMRTLSKEAPNLIPYLIFENLKVPMSIIQISNHFSSCENHQIKKILVCG